VLGNHDYGDYQSWESPQAKDDNLRSLIEYQDLMGFKMLNNQSIQLEKDGQTIRLAGVENWGEPPFKQYGDLAGTLGDVEADEFTILMTHDPTHWDAEVRGHQKQVHLTLSGHTHGFQMGIEIPGIRLSPVQLRYRQWAGIYEENGEFLYVNRGFGFIGFPGRVGIWPEVTVLELQKA
ncbi:MAG: metallophosphoesterase, partial [Bacteroidota bacterium]